MHDTHLRKSCSDKKVVLVLYHRLGQEQVISRLGLSPSRSAPFRGSLSLPKAPSFWPAGCAWRSGAYGLAYPIQ